MRRIDERQIDTRFKDFDVREYLEKLDLVAKIVKNNFKF